jgi:hydrogenase/urease accessory protein HupE
VRGWAAVGSAAAFAALLSALAAPAAFAHSQPYSFLDLHLSSREIRGTVAAHVFDLAHEIGLATPDSLLDPARASVAADTLARVLDQRLEIRADGRRVALRWLGAEPSASEKRVTFRFEAALGGTPGELDVQARLFPYDPQHETYLNVYEGDSLRLQALLDARHADVRHYTGGRQGFFAVLRTFTAAGVHHIFIGPDHILFVIGLLLLGGGIPRLLKIVTSFTAAHSITLALATLGILRPPGRFVEPLIALSIVFVGIENLRARSGHGDHRMKLAFFFGLVHGFGFASVLSEFGLPQVALAGSLFAFNAGVEIGQACIVTAVAPSLLVLHRARPEVAGRVVRVGSWLVSAAGFYWFVERVLAIWR